MGGTGSTALFVPGEGLVLSAQSAREDPPSSKTARCDSKAAGFMPSMK